MYFIQTILFIAECDLNWKENCSGFNRLLKNHLILCINPVHRFYQVVFSAVYLKPSRSPHYLPVMPNLWKSAPSFVSLSVLFCLILEERAHRRWDFKERPATSDEEPLLRTVKFLRLCSCLQAPL